jgi:hypothetical protein
MNRLNYFKIACISGVLLLGTLNSCNKADDSQGSSADGPIRQEAKNVNVSGLNANAVSYYDNIKTAIFATGTNLPVTKSSTEEGENPLIEKLESLQIIKEETSADVSFFEMNADEQELFLDDWAVLQSEQLSEKFAIAPELEDAIKAENEVVREVLDEELQPGTKGGKPRIANNKAFFAKIRERLAERTETVESQNSAKPETRVIGVSTNNTISYTKLRDALRSSGRRGDFLLALPMHNNAFVYLNPGNSAFAVGHAGVVTAIPSATATEETRISVGTQSQGVVKETLHHWSSKCYIMGIQKVRWVWRWRGFRSGFYREITQMNPAPLASWAESFMGREYVRWYEFLTAKWAAPSRFTCTTLVWWCAKKAYGVNVSEWWKTMVTPSGLFSDESTYLRRNVQ